jgi:hypothetical protein
MRRSRWVPALLAVIVATFAIRHTLVESAGPTLSVRYAYLLVSVEGPPSWAEQYRPSIAWDGKEVRLPVVFRCRVTGNNVLTWGAMAETEQSLSVMSVEVPVRVATPTACRVSNEPSFGLIPERSNDPNKTFSMATWVTVGPPDRPNADPTEPLGQNLAEGKDVVRRIEELVATGHVIDVEPRSNRR